MSPGHNRIAFAPARRGAYGYQNVSTAQQPPASTTWRLRSEISEVVVGRNRRDSAELRLGRGSEARVLSRRRRPHLGQAVHLIDLAQIVQKAARIQIADLTLQDPAVLVDEDSR